MELGGHGLARHALGLVDREHDLGRGPPQLVGDVPVARGHALTAVDHEDHQVGLEHRLARLARHLGGDAALGNRLEAAGVDHDEAPLADPTLAVVAIAREAGQVVDQRVAAAREPIEEGRLADVRPSDDGHHRRRAAGRDRVGGIVRFVMAGHVIRPGMRRAPRPRSARPRSSPPPSAARRSVCRRCGPARRAPRRPARAPARCPPGRPSPRRR